VTKLSDNGPKPISSAARPSPGACVGASRCARPRAGTVGRPYVEGRRAAGLAAGLSPRLPIALALWLALSAAALADGLTIRPVSITSLQSEPVTPEGRYDWGPSVMRDDDGLYKMWWVRLGGTGQEKRFPFSARLPDGGVLSFTYPDWGDRVYYAESADGVHWALGVAPMVLAPAESRQEINHVGTPAVIKVSGTYFMYYETCADYLARQRADGSPYLESEYHNQVFVATSDDGRAWHKRLSDRSPQPVVAAPRENLDFGRQRYGLGQPSAFCRDGRFVLHYVDSCTGPGDFIVRVEADNPYFHAARSFPLSLRSANGAAVPAGSVARFAQTDVKPLGDTYYLIRPAYGTGKLGILASRDGLFRQDADAVMPGDVYPQIDVPDPRGSDWLERLYPDFLTTPTGEILVENGRVAIYYSSGAGFKDRANTWDLFRADVSLRDLRRVAQACRAGGDG